MMPEFEEEDHEEQAAQNAHEKRHLSAAAKFSLFVAVVTFVVVVVMAMQLDSRNEDLDSLTDSAASLEVSVGRLETQTGDIKDSITELKATSDRIKEIAEGFAQEDPEQAARLAELFRKIDAIYAEVVEGQ